MRAQLTRHVTAVGLIGFLILIVPSSPAAAQETQETQDTAALPEALRTARADFSAAFKQLDAAAAAASFADAGAVDILGEIIAGRAAVRDWLSSIFVTMDAITVGASGFRIADGEVRERGDYLIRGADGEQSGQVETVWKLQEDGTWKVARLNVM